MKLIGILTLLAAFTLMGDDKAAAKKAPAKAAAVVPAAKVLDINSAKLDELEALPVVGKVARENMVGGP